MTLPPNLLYEAEAKALEERSLLGESRYASFMNGVHWLFTRLCEMSEGEFDETAERELAQAFYSKMNCCPQDDRHSFVEGARHQHSLDQAALLKAREMIKGLAGQLASQMELTMKTSDELRYDKHAELCRAKSENELEGK